MTRLFAVVPAVLLALFAATAAAQTTTATRSLRVANISSDVNHEHTRSNASPLFPANHDGSTMHLVFSVGCGQLHRLLLTTVLQQSAMRVGQRGPITQIVSGCSLDQKAAILREPTFYYDFRVHFTPSYVPHPLPEIDDVYMPYNKPFGLRHFLQHASPAVQHPILVLIDCDYVFFKPLVVNTGRNVTTYYKGARDVSTITDTVRDGIALAQDWTVYMHSGWFDTDKSRTLCGSAPCGNVSIADGREFYARTGPPYILTVRDMRAMIDDYCAFVVRGRQLAPDEWMVEMHAYALAAANHHIQHTVLTNLGVTHPQNDASEYWSFLSSESESNINPCSDPFEIALPADPPVGVHFCQSYRLHDADEDVVDGVRFYKYALPLEVVGCNATLLAVPPATEFDAIDEVYKDADAETRRRKRHEVWTECSLIKQFNSALRLLKRTTCASGAINTFQGLKLRTKK